MKRKNEDRVRTGKLGGRPRVYDLSGLEIGQTTTLAWKVDARGDRLADQSALHEAVRREGRRLGQSFLRVGRSLGLVIKRTA